MKKLNKKGFTIVELVIVIAVIAILAAVMIPTFSGIITKANQSTVQQTAAALYKEAYALDLADGTLDGREGTTAIGKVEGKDVTYSASMGEDGATPTVSFTYEEKGYVATYDGTAWSVISAADDDAE